jgi:Cu/Ag efflux pump CusA
MLSAIVSAALRYRVLVLCGACVLVWVGWRGLRDAPMDVFPEFAPPLAEVQTEAPGLSTEEVDALVTVPVESALNGLPWLKTVRSKSVAGLSSVVLIFEEGTELMASRVGIQERLAQARVRLPAVAKAPVLLPPHSSLSRVMKLGMTSRVMTQVEMSELAVWTVRPRLMAVPGVANVAIWGQRDEEYQVLVDPERLRASGVTLDQVVRAAGDAAVVTAGGFVETPNQRLPVRMTPPVRSAEDLRAAVIEVPGGVRLRLGDVAEVVKGHAPAIGDAIINDEPGLLLIVEKVPWGNTLEVTRGVEAALDALQAGMPGVEVDRRIFRPATFIEESLANLTRALWVGCGLVVVVLVCFLFDWRTAVISLTAIPLSLLAAVLVLRWQGQTINTMVLAGLVIALGEVVDDAVIDVENVLRRLRENALAGVRRRAALPVILEASLEVRSAVVVATLVVVLVT